MKNVIHILIMAAVIVLSGAIIGSPIIWAQNNGVGFEDIDTDGDGLSDYQERAIYQTFWYDEDTDDDGFNDYDEVKNGYSPKHPELTMLQADTDNDGLNDAWEIALGSNLMIRDTDKDGYLDGGEVYFGYSPTNPAPIKVEKRIEVSIADLRLRYYHGDKMIDDIPISGGKPTTPTPTGEFTIIDKVPSKHYQGSGFDYPNTKWNLHFTTRQYRYYIHGAYWHDQFGKKSVSSGCVNVRYQDMERLYNWADLETKVSVKQ